MKIISENKTTNEFVLGSNYPHLVKYKEYENFEGEISEFNIWNRSLSSETITKMTKNCGNFEPKPDILNWSQLTGDFF